MNSFLSCEQAKNMISPYFDRELPEEQAEILQTHLENCSECAGELESIKQLSSVIKTSYQADNEQKGLFPDEIENCLKIKTNLSAFIDGELEKDSMLETLEHIMNCGFCRKQYEKTKKTHELVKNYFQRSVCDDISVAKPGIYTGVIKKLKTLKERKRIVSSVAAVIFAALLTWFSAGHLELKTPEGSNMDNIKFIRTDKPIYVNAEDMFLSEINLEPPEEIVSLIYGD